MEIREYVALSIERTRQATLDMVSGLTPSQLRWQPGPEANPIAFLLFHVFRSEDRFFHRWVGAQQEEMWERAGWSARWRLPAPPVGADPAWVTGSTWTPEEVAAWQPPPLEELLAYGQAVRVSAREIVRTLDYARLLERPRPDRPHLTIAHYLHIAVQHEAQHQGQIDYLLGLMKATGAG